MTFHEHLDACEQCREHPFALCPEGEKCLKQDVDALENSFPFPFTTMPQDEA